VRLEQLIPGQQSAAPPVPPPEQTPPVVVREDPPPAAPAPLPAAQEPRVETIQLISPSQPQAPPSVQYITLPSVQSQNCFNSPLCIAIFILLIIAVLLLVAILVLLLYMRRVPWWPWYHPVWLRRHLRYLKKRAYRR
jgi:hypothetical protein